MKKIDYKLRIAPYVQEQLGYYVYRLLDPDDRSVLYVGKGQGERILAHVNEAIDYPERQTRKLERIRDPLKAKKKPLLGIHRHGLPDERTAYEVEAALIDAHPDALNQVAGHDDYRGSMSLEEAIALYSAPPATIKEPVVLIKIAREWDRELRSNPERLYERTRRWWVCDPTHRSAKYAMAVAAGVIRQVYTIQSWRQCDISQEDHDPTRRSANAPMPRRSVRWEFTGAVAEGMKHYIGQSVKTGQNPINWVNCPWTERTLVPCTTIS
jgi:uncharacterized protein